MMTVEPIMAETSDFHVQMADANLKDTNRQVLIKFHQN